jgi:hypothetical protein
LSTHALRTSDSDTIGVRILRNIDLIVLAIALPVWVALQLPALGYAAAATGWLAARFFQSWVERRALAKGNRRAVLGARAASLVGRLYMVTIAVFVAGLIDHEAGVTAGILAAVVFTFYLASTFVMAALEGD